MKDRIKRIREENQMSQQAFADALGVSKSSIEKYEYGARQPTNALSKVICDRFSVNEQWLLTGEGNMYASVSREKAVYDAIRKARPDMPDSFPKDVAAAMAKLSSEDWMFLARLAQDMAKKAREMRAAEPEKPQDEDNFIYGVTAAKNAQPTPFKVQAGRDEELFREAQELDESDKDD